MPPPGWPQALRVFPAETLLAVYRRRLVMNPWANHNIEMSGKTFRNDETYFART